MRARPAASESEPTRCFRCSRRALLEYLDRKTKELQAQNKFAEWAMCIVKCCMKCLEWIVRFINRNAYIMIAIKGKGYCCAAMDAIALIVSVGCPARPPRCPAAHSEGSSRRYPHGRSPHARLQRSPHPLHMNFQHGLPNVSSCS